MLAGPGVWAWAVPFDSLAEALEHLERQLRPVCASRSVTIDAGGRLSTDIEAAMAALREAPDGSCWPVPQPVRRSSPPRPLSPEAAPPAR